MDSLDPIVETMDITFAHFADPDVFVANFFCTKFPTRPNYRPYGEKEALSSVEFQKENRNVRYSYTLPRPGDAMMSSGSLVNWDGNRQSSLKHIIRIFFTPV